MFITRQSILVRQTSIRLEVTGQLVVDNYQMMGSQLSLASEHDLNWYRELNELVLSAQVIMTQIMMTWVNNLKLESGWCKCVNCWKKVTIKHLSMICG